MTYTHLKPAPPPGDGMLGPAVSLSMSSVADLGVLRAGAPTPAGASTCPEVRLHRYWHGGVPDLRSGDLLEAGHARRLHDGCPGCAARAAGSAIAGPNGFPIDPPTGRPDMVYITTDRDYGRFHASLWGYGDLYQVEPVGQAERSTEDHFETWCVRQARIIAVVDRAVLLTPGQRRSLYRKWAAADRLALGR